MKYKNIIINGEVEIEPTSMCGLNNVLLANGVRIAKNCSIFGSEKNILEIGEGTYVGMNTILNGFSAKLSIGKNVSFAQNVNVMTDSGPNASTKLQKLFPIETGNVIIGNHCWIGASAIIMPNVVLGDFCVVAAGSFVKDSFPAYSVIGGTPARIIKELSEQEREILNK